MWDFSVVAAHVSCASFVSFLGEAEVKETSLLPVMAV